ncbi:MAG TPA: rhomboid family intramembrane serine protease [Gemmatimonadales bacterium]|nr:rhomboid family intramembrane serine protease [Gemmatimonadales bacterium]
MTLWVRRIIVLNIAVFVMTSLVPGLVEWLALLPAAAAVRPWTPITYMFVHAGIAHIFFNMLVLFFFGPKLEVFLGGRRFLSLYFASGLAGAALSFVTPMVPIVGASGAINGVLLAYAMTWPRDRFYIWGILPLEAWFAVTVFAGLDVLGALGVVQPGIAHFAHLGGLAGGFLYLQWDRRRRAAAPRPRVVVRPSGGNQADLARWERIQPETLHPVNREELERVLAKIAATGVGSLSPDERAFLDRFSDR